MFSATFGTDVQELCGQLLGQNYFFVRVGAPNAVVDTISQKFIEVLIYPFKDEIVF
jgi:superfamily II DNA/RNA helicase